MKKKPGLLERLRAKKSQRDDMVVGVAWYTEEQWARVKARAVNPALFEATYPEWVTMAEDALKEIRGAVGNPIKIYLDADELAAWCLVHGKQNDSSARAEFASYDLRHRRMSRSPMRRFSYWASSCVPWAFFLTEVISFRKPTRTAHQR